MRLRQRTLQNIHPTSFVSNPKVQRPASNRKRIVQKENEDPNRNLANKQKKSKNHPDRNLKNESNVVGTLREATKTKKRYVPQEYEYQEQINAYLIERTNSLFYEQVKEYRNKCRDIQFYLKYRDCFLDSVYKQCFNFQLKRTTMFLTVAFLDQFLLKNSEEAKLNDEQQHIVWTYAAFLMAQKFQQIYPPSICQWLPDSYHNKVYREEAKITKKLNFDFNIMTVQHYYEYFRDKFKLSEHESKNCEVKLDLLLFRNRILLKYPPHRVARAIVYMSIIATDRDRRLPGLNSLKELIDQILQLLDNEGQKLQWICKQRRKYEQLKEQARKGLQQYLQQSYHTPV